MKLPLRTTVQRWKLRLESGRIVYVYAHAPNWRHRNVLGEIVVAWEECGYYDRIGNVVETAEPVTMRDGRITS